jgi:Tol biopolymer transport system component
VVSLATGQNAMIADSVRGERTKWTDSGWIYYTNLEGGVCRVRPTGGEPELVVEQDPSWHIASNIEVAGSDHVIFARKKPGVVDPAQAELVVHNVKTRQSASLGKGVRAIYNDRHRVITVAQANGILLAARFDGRDGRMQGSFVKVLEGVETGGESRSVSASFSLSKNGDLLYITKEKISADEVVWLGRTGLESRGRVPLNGWMESIPAISRDGKAILASVCTAQLSAPNIWLRNIPDGSAQRLTFGDNLDYSPAFDRAEKALTFVSQRGNENWDLYRLALDGKSGVEKILDRTGDIQDPHFSPGEDAVLFTERDAKGQTDVRVHRFDRDAGTVDVARTDANESSARFSPDGRHVVYVSSETGRSQVYVVPYPNPNNLRWQISAEGGGGPVWSHSGDELFYRAPGDDLLAVKVNTQAAFSFGKPERLFNLNEMLWTRQVTPDDQNFILVRREMRAPGQVVLVKNWMQEVLRKLDGR